MIRKLLFFAAALIFVAVVAYMMLFSRGSGPKVSPQAELARWATEELMAQTDGIDIRFLVVGAQVDKTKWEFRGMVERSAGSSPGHGVVELTCKRPRRKIECWQLSELYIDGRSWDAAGTTTANNQPEPEAASQPEQPAPAVTETPQPQPAAQPEPQPQPEPVIEKWRTTRSIVNARKGPGTTHPIVTRITPSYVLTLVSKDEGWGQFEVIEPERLQGQIVWIWLDLVEQYEG